MRINNELHGIVTFYRIIKFEYKKWKQKHADQYYFS